MKKRWKDRRMDGCRRKGHNEMMSLKELQSKPRGEHDGDLTLV